MANPSLEKVLKEKVEPMVDEAMQKYLGITVQEIGKDITDKIEKNPLISFEFHTELKFKVAKKLFKKEFLTRLIQNKLGNVSEVAKITGMDRRSIHRAVKELGINIKKTRKELIRTEYYQREAVDGILKNTLDSYKNVIVSDRLAKMYQVTEKLSSDIVKELPHAEMPWKEAEKEFELRYLEKALNESNGNLSRAAKKIGIRYETLHRKLKMLRL